MAISWAGASPRADVDATPADKGYGEGGGVGTGANPKDPQIYFLPMGPQIYFLSQDILTVSLKDFLKTSKYFYKFLKTP